MEPSPLRSQSNSLGVSQLPWSSDGGCADADPPNELGTTSPDGRFTVIEVECLGACGFPTPILVDDADFIESVTPEQVPGILARYQ